MGSSDQFTDVTFCQTVRFKKATWRQRHLTQSESRETVYLDLYSHL